MNPNTSPVDWAKRPLQKYADFSERAPRAEYWWFFLGLIVAYVVATIVDSILGLNHLVLGVYGPVTMLLWLATLVPSVAVGVRRLHDTDRSGWWILLPVVPYLAAFILGGAALMRGQMAAVGIAGIFILIGAVCALVLLIFFVLGGTPGNNRYGPNPYGADEAAAH
jgi:uncharacterized membrane protein YhaH (DUF805 family)